MVSLEPADLVEPVKIQKVKPWKWIFDGIDKKHNVSNFISVHEWQNT